MAESRPVTSIVIVAYNSLPVILTCLESVLRFSHSDEREIIVVDNGSTDGTPEVVKSEFPEVNVIAARENLGFSKANNLGLEHANGQCVCFLNPDTEFRDDTMVVLSDWLWRNLRRRELSTRVPGRRYTVFECAVLPQSPEGVLWVFGPLETGRVLAGVCVERDGVLGSPG